MVIAAVKPNIPAMKALALPLINAMDNTIFPSSRAFARNPTLTIKQPPSGQIIVLTDVAMADATSIEVVISGPWFRSPTARQNATLWNAPLALAETCLDVKAVPSTFSKTHWAVAVTDVFNRLYIDQTGTA